MSQLARTTTVELVTALLSHYSFDLGGSTTSQLINRWLSNYPTNWVRAAVIEALYRGRYKAISIDQILTVWQRRGVALHNFNHEFERLVCADLPQTLTESAMNFVDEVAYTDYEASMSAEQATIGKIKPASSVAVVEPTVHASNHSKAQMRSHNGHQSPIVRFSPPEITASDFYSKLKAISLSKNDVEQ